MRTNCESMYVGIDYMNWRIRPADRISLINLKSILFNLRVLFNLLKACFMSKVVLFFMFRHGFLVLEMNQRKRKFSQRILNIQKRCILFCNIFCHPEEVVFHEHQEIMLSTNDSTDTIRTWSPSDTILGSVSATRRSQIWWATPDNNCKNEQIFSEPETEVIRHRGRSVRFSLPSWGACRAKGGKEHF